MTDMPNLSTAKPKARLFWALDGPNTDTGPFTFNYDYYTEHDSDGDGVAAQYETLPTKEIDEQTLRREHVRRTVKLHIEKTLKAWASKRKVATDDPSSTGVEWKITSVSVADLDYFGVLKKEIRDEAYDGMDVTARRAVLTDFMDMITYDYSSNRVQELAQRFQEKFAKRAVTILETQSKATSSSVSEGQDQSTNDVSRLTEAIFAGNKAFARVPTTASWKKQSTAKKWQAEVCSISSKSFEALIDRRE